MNIYHRDGSLITDQYDTVSAAVAAGVNLTGANLIFANLSGTNLSRADLSRAVIHLGNRTITLGKDQ